MTRQARKTMWLALLAVAAVLIAMPFAGAAERTEGAPDLAGKRILLSNDDSVQASKPNGSDGRGLYELRKSLCAAGADVVVVGPWGQQSGRSRATGGGAQVTVATPLTIPADYAADCVNAPSRGQVYGVCQGVAPCVAGSTSASPADSVDLALGALLADRVGWSGPPDITLTGINSGANAGLSINMSGTVGAATASLEHGVAAVAVSGGTAATSVPSDDTYRTAATYTTGLVGRLFADGASGKLAREQILLNVNAPDVGPGRAPEPRWTSVGRVALERFAYQKSGQDTYSLTFGPVEPAPKPEQGSDTAALSRGELSISAVSAYRGVEDHADWLERMAVPR